MSDKNIVVAVDLDGTLAEYHGWNDGQIGEPVPAMLVQVKEWLGLGYEVRVFTARVADLHRDDYEAGDTWSKWYRDALKQLVDVHEWVLKHVGQNLTVTAVKDSDVTELWDDRAVRVEKNTGVSELHDAHARLSAAGIPPGPLPKRMRALIDLYVGKVVESESLHSKILEAETKVALLTNENEILRSDTRTGRSCHDQE